MTDNYHRPGGINDTAADVESRMCSAYRAMPGWKKLRQVSQLTQAVQVMALSRMRAQYSRRPEREERLRLGALWVSPALMKAAFGWDPEIEGY